MYELRGCESAWGSSNVFLNKSSRKNYERQSWHPLRAIVLQHQIPRNVKVPYCSIDDHVTFVKVVFAKVFPALLVGLVVFESDLVKFSGLHWCIKLNISFHPLYLQV